MITIAKIIGSVITNGIKYIKLTRFGRNDHQEVIQITPFGIESTPVKDLKTIHTNTINDSKSLSIGIVCKHEKTQEGETRVYATNSAGVTQFEIYLKSNGTCQFNGTGEFLTKYNALDTALQASILALNTELGKIQEAIIALGGAYAFETVSLDISQSKATELETSI